MTLGDSTTEGRRSKPRTTRAARRHVSAYGGFGDGEDSNTSHERVLVEQDGEVVTVRAGVEVLRDVWHMILHPGGSPRGIDHRLPG